MTINEAVTAIESLLTSKQDAMSFQARPSGDDVDVIKVWVDLGESKVDPDAWAKAFEAEIRKQIPGAAPFRLQVRAESGA